MELLNDGKMPQRLIYPTQQKFWAIANYNIAVQSLGGDNINVKGWVESIKIKKNTFLQAMISFVKRFVKIFNIEKN